jgi:drug/metabolite transporter (DMT)-like permease
MQSRVLALILVTVLMSAVGQLALKFAVEKANFREAVEGGFMSAAAAAVGSPFFWGALAIYGVSVALWLWVLSRAELSVAYPFVSLGFVVTLGFAAIFLNETVTTLKLVGTLLIVAGCYMVARSA